MENASAIGDFFSLTPEQVLASVEHSGHATTGLCYALNSLENRVYEVELDDDVRVIAKFYRPGRWSKQAILDEHRLLQALIEAEIPACAPLSFPDGATLHQTAQGIFFTLFPKVGGRCPDELVGNDYEQLGRLLARIHNVSSSLSLQHRPRLVPETYGLECLQQLQNGNFLPASVQTPYSDAVRTIVDIGQRRFEHVDAFVVHGDCHRANLLRGRDGWFFLDFDDSGHSAAVQDIWLLLPARRTDCPAELEAFLKGYEQFRAFDHASLRLIEVLRALRYVRYAAWVATRWQDPSFPRAFPSFGTERYWQDQLNDLYEQIAILRAEDYI